MADMMTRDDLESIAGTIEEHLSDRFYDHPGWGEYRLEDGKWYTLEMSVTIVEVTDEDELKRLQARDLSK